jgi:hypothetical protein
MKTTTRAALAAPLLLTLVLSSGCGGASSSSGSDDSGVSTSSRGTAPDGLGTTDSERAPTAVAPAGGKAAGTVRQAVAPLQRAVVSTGQLAIHARDVARARGAVFTLVAGWGGTVADEKTGSDAHGRLSDSTMTLRVPSPRFDVAMDALAKVGSVEQQSRSAQDVTTQVIDNRARVRAAERSIRSIENLLGRAVRLSDVIAIESDLARRQADLDSLEQQEAWLSDQTSLSTITLTLSRPMPHPAKKHTEARGFLAGLDGGWSALQGATVVGLTLVGAAFPFALLIALVGVPLWIAVRRRRPVAPPAQV